MKTYKYTSDVWGSEPFDTPTMDAFEIAVEEIHRVAGWGKAPAMWIEDSRIVAEGDTWASGPIVVGEIVIDPNVTYQCTLAELEAHWATMFDEWDLLGNPIVETSLDEVVYFVPADGDVFTLPNSPRWALYREDRAERFLAIPDTIFDANDIPEEATPS